jgi:hypothetical protein
MYVQDYENEMLKNANAVKEVVLWALEREGLLTKPAAEIGERYAIVLHKKGWFGVLWDKWFDGIKDGNLKITPGGGLRMVKNL